MRLAFVVQRYGLDIAGGAEYHCRLVAQQLARHAQVEVLTTCAADYITWANHYPEGLEELEGVPVRRFRVKRPRDPERFAAWTDRVPAMIQTLLVASFENTGKIVAVGRESVGLRADFLLKTEIRKLRQVTI